MALRFSNTLAAVIIDFSSVKAAVAEWGQCGDVYYTGDTTFCSTGSLLCRSLHRNGWYYQCLPAPSSSSSVRPASSARSSSSSTSHTTTTSFSRTATTSSRTSTSPATTTTGLRHLNLLAKAHGRYFGTATDSIWSNNGVAYKAITGNFDEFGIVTPANAMKWLLWRSDIFYNTIGPSLVSIVLRTARSVDPNAKLYIDDYNVEGTGVNSNAHYALARSLKSQGVPLDGFGNQGHLIVGSVPTSIATNVARFAALGLEWVLTELDICMTLPATQQLLTQEATDYKNVVDACLVDALHASNC
ncbi:hypothetical protein FRB99_004211 [Tulasnella sp. 403]|nr:hypothetical protein FRB99_004211 [Tulasnella sp. 403]